MKKLLSFALVILIALLVSMLAIPTFAETYSGTCGDNVNWSFDTETGVLAISGNGPMKNYSSSTMPWSSHRSSIKSVVISEGVTSIGSAAFGGCSSLTSIEIPDSVTSIGLQAFRGCSSLTSITIPDGVTSIWPVAFYYCSSLTSITIPDSVTSIGNHAFYNCSSLTSITIPNSVTSIGEYAFYNCSSLSDIYYRGTESQWNAISKSSNWSNGIENLTIHYVGMNAVDMNGDGEFTYLDISKLYAAYRGVSEVASGVDTDVNGDGTFSYLDVSKLYAIYRGLADF